MGRLYVLSWVVGGEWWPVSGVLVRRASLAVGEWTHVVVTRSGSTVTWYLNGVQDSQFTASVTPVGVVVAVDDW